jgi:hypothetical protein
MNKPTHNLRYSSMTATQYRAALAELALSQSAAARLFGAAGRTSRRWAWGERAVPPTVAILLRLMLDGHLTIEQIVAAQERNKITQQSSGPIDK